MVTIFLVLTSFMLRAWPYGAEYAVETRRNKEKFWSLMTDKTNNIGEESSQTNEAKDVCTSKEVAT